MEDAILDVLISIIESHFLLDIMHNGDISFTAQQLDELITLSAKIGEVETTGFLMDYKHRHFGEGNYLDGLSLEDGLDNSLNDNFDDSLGDSK